ncbi:MAG TPA: hypothetical protein VFK33_09230 [Bacillales bacterium]|nr:hypothetical protein [Bacillales bacterium]
MKKLLMLVMIAVLALSVAACNSGSTNNANGSGGKSTAKNEQSKSDNASSKKKEMSMLMDWEMSMLGPIHNTVDPFNTLTDIAGDKKKTDWADGDKEQIQQLVPGAVKAGNSFDKKVKDVKVPSGLPKADQKKIKSAVKDLTAYFEAKGKAVKDLKNVSSFKDYKAKVKAMNQAGMKEFNSFVSTVKSLEKKAGFDKPNGLKGEFK